MDEQSGQVYKFGSYHLDPSRHLLFKEGRAVSLPPKAVEMLCLLINRHGEVVDKEEFFKRLWPDTVVEESNITQTIYLIRRALGRTEANLNLIETVGRIGYRFTARVDILTTDEAREERQGQAPHPAHAPEVVESPEAEETKAQPTDTPVLTTLGAATASARLPFRPQVRARLLSISLLSLILIIAVTLFYLRTQGERSPVIPAQSINSLAVLPFRTLDPSDHEDHLGLGITDALITKLGGVLQLSVRPMSSVFKYADQSGNAVAVGYELHVDAILEGSVQHVGDKVRVTVLLLRVADEHPLWSGVFEGQFKDIFMIQDEMADRITRALSLELADAERMAAAQHFTDNPKAYEAYTRGLYFWNKRDKDSLMRSLAYFEDAIGQDSNYAQAYAKLSDTYGLIGFYGFTSVSQDEAFQKARRAAHRAIELNPSLAEPYIARAMVDYYYEKDVPATERDLKRALALNPKDATAHHRYALLLREHGRLDEAATEIAQAHEMDPVSIAISFNVGYIAFLQRDYERANAYFQKAQEINSSYIPALLGAALIYEHRGDYESALEVLGRARALAKDNGLIYYDALEMLGYTYASMGRREEARKILDEINGMPEKSFDKQVHEVVIYAGLGERDKAVRLIRAYQSDWSARQDILMDPRLDSLRRSTEFLELLNEISSSH